jgi:hypothetical protein
MKWKKIEIDYKRGFRFMIIVNFFVILMMIGMSMNFVVIQSNAGRMPVYGLNYETSSHFGYEENDTIKNRFFADNFEIYGDIFSIGDLLMFISIICIILTGYIMIYTRWGINKAKQKKKDGNRKI